MTFQAQQPGSLSSALQAASPLLLSAAQGLRQGNFQGGLQAGLQGMMALQERNKEKAAEQKVNEVIQGMNIPTSQRAILETMPLAQRQQYVMQQMQRPARGGGGAAVSPAPEAPVDPYAGILQGLTGNMQPAQAPQPAGGGLPLSFGQEVPNTVQGGAGVPRAEGGAGADNMRGGLAFSLGSQAPASERMLSNAPIRSGAPQQMAMPAPPPPPQVDPAEQITQRIGQIDQAIQRAAIDPRVATTTDGRRMIQSLQDARANLAARLESMQPQGIPDQIRILKLRAEEAGLRPGTDEYRNFMLTGGRAGDVTQFTAADGTSFYSGPPGALPVDGVPQGQDPNATATPRDPGKLAESLSSDDAAYLGALRTEAKNAETLEGLSQRLNILGDPERIGYTGPGGELYHFIDQVAGDALPGDAGARAAFKSAGVEAQLTFTERTKGAITEREMALFAAATPNLTNVAGGNKLIADVLEAGAKRQQTRFNFFEAYARKRGSLEGAEGAWDQYMNANPILQEGPNGELKVQQEGDWRAALEAPQAMDFTPEAILQMDASQIDALPVEQMTEQQIQALEIRLQQLGGQ